MSRTIPLRHGREAYIDEEDWEKEFEFEGQTYKVCDMKWYAIKNRNTFYCRATVPGSGGKKVYLHRIVMDAPPDLMVDHRDHNGLNDTKENLSLVTNSENQMNKASQGGTSEYKGVYKARHGWAVEINTPTRGVITITGIVSEEAAAKRYDKLAKKHHGKNAMLNFSEE